MKVFKACFGVIIFLISSLSTSVLAQGIYDLNKHMVQPEHSSFTEYDKPTVDAQGNLNLSINLGVVPGRGIDFPITLTYQSGIKVMQPSSWIGLGWNFSPGAISRTPSIGYVDPAFGSSYQESSGVDIFDISGVNRAPDRFTVTLPGRGSAELVQVKEPSFSSNTYPQYQTGDFVTLDHKAWKIEYQTGIKTIAGVTTGIRLDLETAYDATTIDEKQDFTKFLITVEDGTSYLFSEPTMAYVDLEDSTSAAQSTILKRQDYISTWRLVAIFGDNYQDSRWSVPSGTEKGSWVKLTYGSVYMDYDDGNAGHDKEIYRQTRYLSEIKTPVGSANFTTASRIEPMLQGWEKDEVYFTNNTQRKLTKIKFYEGGLIKEIDFIHDNSFNPYPDGETSKGRLKLKEITIKGKNGGNIPGYEFSYVENPSISWPYGLNNYEMITCLDEYGYINESELGWMNTGFTSGCESPIGGADSHDKSKADSWSLSSITYPTGLVDSVDYRTKFVKGDEDIDFYRLAEDQPDYYKPLFSASASDSVFVGGPLVHSIKRASNFDSSNNDEVYVQKYSYSGATLSGIPNNYFKISGYDGDYNMVFSGSTDDGSIYYSKVETMFYPGGSNGAGSYVSKEVKKFSIGNDPIIIQASESVACPGEYYIEIAPGRYPTCLGEYVWSDNRTWNWGKLLVVKQETNSGIAYTKIDSTQYNYSIAGTSNPGRTNHIWTVEGSTLSHTANLYQRAKRISSKISIDGDSYSETSYSYKTNTNLKNEIISETGSSEQRKKKITRAHEISQYSEIKNRNMLTQVVREDIGYKESGSWHWKNSSTTTWKYVGSISTPEFYRPWKKFSWKADQPQTGSPASFSEWTSGSTPSGWLLEKEMTEYDDYGNLKEVLLPNSTTISYGYFLGTNKLSYVGIEEGVGTNPTSLDINIWYDNDFRKVSRTRDQNEVNTYYEYDEFGRLISIKNHNQKLLKSYQYDYELNFSPSYTLNRIIKTTYTNPSDTSDNIRSYMYYDGMARIRQSVSEFENSYLVNHYDYDEMGFLEKEWRPYLDHNIYISNGEFLNPSTARSAVTQYYKTELGLSYNPHPYTKTEYYDIAVPKLYKEFPAWTNTQENNQVNFGQATVNGVATRYSQMIDEEGNKTKVYKNYLGEEIRRIVAENTSSEMITDFEYDEVGNLVKSISPRGLETTYEYNTLGQLTQKTLPDQDASVDYRYDKVGNLRFERDANHKSQKNDLSTSINGGTYVSKTLTVTTDGELELDYCWVDLFLGNYYITVEDTDTGVDIDTKTLSSESGCQGPFTYEVEPGNYRFIGQAQDPGDIVTFQGTFAFDSYDVYKYTKYDRLGRPIETGEYSGGVSFASANPDDEDFPTMGHQPNVKYYYDGDQAYNGGALTPQNLNGRISKKEYRDLSETGGWGDTWYSYNALGLVEAVIQKVPGLAQQHIINYSYDEFGRLTQIDYEENLPFNAEEFHWRYSYDDMGRLEKVETSSNGSTWIKDVEYSSYSADNQIEQVRLGNSNIQTVDYAHDIRGWLEKVNNTSSIGSDKFAMKLSYAANGNISQQQWRQPAKNSYLATYNYSYDAANRLTSANFTGSGYSSNAFDVTNITYDDNGNLTQYIRYDNAGDIGQDATGYMGYTIESGSNKINYSRDQILYEQYDFSYDANGNMTENELNGLVSAQYDWRNLPSQMITGSATLKYAYDADGNRVKKARSGGTETLYVRGANGEPLVVFVDDHVAFYNIVSGGDVLGTYDGSQRRYFIKDQLGSIRTTVDQSGNVDGYDDYYPFGLIMPGRSSNSANPADNYKFTGHERDDEGNLTLDYMMARNYDPEIGRFLQTDPLSAEYPGISPYSYVLNTPLSLNDPSGKFPTCIDNCDEIYSIGSTIENKYGNFRYIGKNRWLDVNNQIEFGSEIASQFIDKINSMEGGFNLIPNQNGPFFYSEIGYTAVEGTGIHGSHVAGGGFNVFYNGSQSNMTYSGYVKTSANAGQKINNESSLNILQNGNVTNSSTFNPNAPTISPFYGKMSNHYNLGTASINLPNSGKFNVQLVTGYSYSNSGIGLISKSTSNLINIYYYTVE
ncbi:RHS repeat domain-containing protein [Gracilimonas sp.]|uniref:RHS repeat domain-containing protein n=1 Tax=Gracilimonas sp. TaxID=1974203 RepID=UPI003BA8E099